MTRPSCRRWWCPLSRRKNVHLAWKLEKLRKDPMGAECCGPHLAPISQVRWCAWVPSSLPQPFEHKKMAPYFTSALWISGKVSLIACADIEQGREERVGNKSSSIPILCTVLSSKGQHFYLINIVTRWYGLSQAVLVVKNLPASAGDTRDPGSIPGSGRSHGRGNGNPLQYCLVGYSSWNCKERLSIHTLGDVSFCPLHSQIQVVWEAVCQRSNPVCSSLRASEDLIHSPSTHWLWHYYVRVYCVETEMFSVLWAGSHSQPTMYFIPF